MKAFLTSMVLALPLAASGMATTSSEMVCTLTGQHVEECCCVEKDGGMVCTLTGETVSSCCCVSASK